MHPVRHVATQIRGRVTANLFDIEADAIVLIRLIAPLEALAVRQLGVSFNLDKLARVDRVHDHHAHHACTYLRLEDRQRRVGDCSINGVLGIGSSLVPSLQPAVMVRVVLRWFRRNDKK